MMTSDPLSFHSHPAPRTPHVWLIDLLCIALVIVLPNLIISAYVILVNTIGATAHSWWHTLYTYIENHAAIQILWLAVNLGLLGILLGLRTHLLKPLHHIMVHLYVVRQAHVAQAVSPRSKMPMTMGHIARDVSRMAMLAMDYYTKYQDIHRDLEAARRTIAEFTLYQTTLITHTGREIGTQYRSVLSYANYLEEQIASNRVDPSIRYDFDDVCESSFNLRLIADALNLINQPIAPDPVPVALAALMQQTMLTLAPALDRRSMKLTTAEVDLDILAQGDAQYISHILWMMLLGMIRYAADESTLRMRCLYNHERTEALLSIVVSELSPLHLSQEERSNHLMRQLQHLTPHMFAETIRIHGNVQLASLLIERIGGTISVLPLTVSSCEIALWLPAAPSVAI
jgi:hypothetical protein